MPQDQPTSPPAIPDVWHNAANMASREPNPHLVPASQQDPHRPLSALLSQVLVAYTVELDNQFELQISRAGHPGARLSLVVWSNLLRFVPASGITLRDLTIQSLAEPSALKHQLGCLERWGFVLLIPESSSIPRLSKEAGWGSGRGIHSAFTVIPTHKAIAAQQIWPLLLTQLDQRWTTRFGADTISSLRASLQAIVTAHGISLPQGFIDLRERKLPFPAGSSVEPETHTLPALLAKVLMAFALEFEPHCFAPLALCASSLRVLGDQAIPERDIAPLTGSSPETAGLGWQIKPYVTVESNPSGARGKFVRLSPRGFLAHQQYRRLAAEIEQSWQTRFGLDTVEALRQTLLSLFDREGNGAYPLLISEGLVPPPGTVRAGDLAPALGRRVIAAAAQQRARDLVAQTQSFLANPAAALPHYPLWDMNRGFGP